MSNGNLNTFLEIAQTVNLSAAKRNTEAILNVALEQNQQILELRRQIEFAQNQANLIASKQLEIQLREEVLKQEQRILRKLVFAFESIIEDGLNLSENVEKYNFFYYDIISIERYIGEAIDKLDNIDDKRSASLQLRKLKDCKDSLRNFEIEFQKSSLGELQYLSKNYIDYSKIEIPKKVEIPYPVVVPYHSKFSIYSAFFAIPLVYLLITFLVFFKPEKEIIEQIKENSESLIFLMILSFAYIYIAVLFIRKYKSKDEVKIENEQRLAKYEERLNLEAIEFNKKIAEYENAKKLEEDQKNRITEMKNKALQEFPNYFLFQNHVLKQFSPERFRVKNI